MTNKAKVALAVTLFVATAVAALLLWVIVGIPDPNLRRVADSVELPPGADLISETESAHTPVCLNAAPCPSFTRLYSFSTPPNRGELDAAARSAGAEGMGCVGAEFRTCGAEGVVDGYVVEMSFVIDSSEVPRLNLQVSRG